MEERPDLAGRVAWTYLATVLAAAGGGLLALLAYQVVDPLACAASAEATEQSLDCSLIAGTGLWVAGFAAAFLGALALLKIERRTAAWLAMLAGLVGLLVGLGAIGQWWWTAALVLLPAAAALVSAPWSASRGFRFAQHAVLAALGVAGLAVFTWQVLAA